MCLWLCSQSYQLQSIQTHGEIKMFTPLMVAWGEGWEKRIVRKLEMVMYTWLYLKWITNKDLLNSTWNSAQCYVAAWMGREFGEEWVPIYIWLSPCTSHLELSQHCKSAIPQYKIKSLQTIWSQQGREKVGRPEKVVLNHIYYHM